MSHNYFKKKKWTAEQEAWLIEHKDIRGKLPMYEEFMKAFPSATYTPEAISSKRTEIGAYGNHPKDRYRNAVPLYSERIKKGYVFIKVSSCEWWSKAKWVWVSTHPGEPFSIRNQFCFIDGDRRNFSPDNIEQVEHKLMGIINRNFGGFKVGNPKLNRVLIAKAKLMLLILDKADKLGMSSDYGSGRMLKSERNRRQREYTRNMTDEQRAKVNKRNREYTRKKKQLDPEYRERLNAYQRQWAKEKRRKRNEGL